MIGNPVFRCQRGYTYTFRKSADDRLNLFIFQLSGCCVRLSFSRLADFSQLFRCLHHSGGMQTRVFPPVHHLQIFRAVVLLVAVDMVHNLILIQFDIQQFFNHSPVLRDFPAVDCFDFVFRHNSCPFSFFAIIAESAKVFKPLLHIDIIPVEAVLEC